MLDMLDRGDLRLPPTRLGDVPAAGTEAAGLVTSVIVAARADAKLGADRIGSALNGRLKTLRSRDLPPAPENVSRSGLRP